MRKKVDYVKFTNFQRKIKPTFTMYAAFQSALVAEDNGKQNLEEPYTNKYQEHVAGSGGYKLVCVHDNISKHFS